MSERNLLAEIDDLRVRIEALEGQTAGHPWIPPVVERLNKIIDERVDDVSFRSDTLVGQIEVNSVIRSRNGTVGWSEDGAVEDLLETDPASLARSIGGLAHPARIALARALLSGPKESSTLLEIAGLNTTGQLYHHLQAMADVGLIERRGRNLWAPLNHGPLLLLMFAGNELSKWRGPDDEETS